MVKLQIGIETPTRHYMKIHTENRITVSKLVHMFYVLMHIFSIYSVALYYVSQIVGQCIAPRGTVGHGFYSPAERPRRLASLLDLLWIKQWGEPLVMILFHLCDIQPSIGTRHCGDQRAPVLNFHSGFGEVRQSTMLAMPTRPGRPLKTWSVRAIPRQVGHCKAITPLFLCCTIPFSSFVRSDISYFAIP